MLLKKSLSSVIATALLFIVAVVAVVNFNIFFNSYSSSLFSKVEIQTTDSVRNTQIDNVFEGTLYFKSGIDGIEIKSVKSNGNNCYVSGVYDLNLNSIPISNCIEIGENKIVVVTNKGIYEKKIYKHEIDYSSVCPVGYILVPGNIELETKNFCVMKFEAKNVGGVATSQASLLPWTAINHTEAINNCSNLGSKYHLITNQEWTTIARNLEINLENWNSSVVGSGFMFSGHNDNGPSNALSVTDENNFYDGTGDSASSCDGFYNNFVVGDDTILGRACLGQKRAMKLNNNETIWDFSGNVREWNNGTCSQGDPWYSTGGWLNWTDANLIGSEKEKELAGPIGDYTMQNGVGSYYGCTSEGNPFVSSGHWIFGERAGVFSMTLSITPGSRAGYLGFRCVYNP